MTTDSKLPIIFSSYGSLTGMLRKFDRYARQSRFSGKTAEEWMVWQKVTRNPLHNLLGLGKMEMCDPCTRRTGASAWRHCAGALAYPRGM